MSNQKTIVSKFNNGSGSGTASNMFIEGDRLFSYGRHFTLAERRDFGAGIKFIINGDRYSNSTSSQTGLCIQGLKNNVQIPFSALRSAGLVEHGAIIKGLEIVDFTKDRTVTTCKTCGKLAVYKDDYTHDDDSPICVPSDPDKNPIKNNHFLGAVLLRLEDRYFLSGIDENEPWQYRAYFLCELPGAVSSVAEAFNSLKPQAVRNAEAQGIEVKRQGDIFCIKEAPTSKVGKISKAFRLFSTSHVATESIIDSKDDIYVRGTLRHRPIDQGRRPEHAMLKLGREWYAAIKNTAIASWSAAGNVD